MPFVERSLEMRWRWGRGSEESLRVERGEVPEGSCTRSNTPPPWARGTARRAARDRCRRQGEHDREHEEEPHGLRSGPRRTSTGENLMKKKSRRSRTPVAAYCPTVGANCRRYENGRCHRMAKGGGTMNRQPALRNGLGTNTRQGTQVRGSPWR